VEEGIDAIDAIENGLGVGMNTISERFDNAEIFLPEIILSADAMQSAVNILEETIDKSKESTKRGKIVSCTVEGDIHNIGISIVNVLLEANNFEVIDLGRDCSIDLLVEKAMECKADIIAASALMTTTRPMFKEIVRLLNEEGYRDKVKVLLGGAPVNQEYVDEVDGDAYGENASEAVSKALELLGG
jgi:corrinoid protein of di/trimethylamine methyltransferase